MAKGKHAAALFEVIHSGKQPADKAGLLRTPKWWFKGRKNPAEASARATEAHPTTDTDDATPTRVASLDPTDPSATAASAPALHTPGIDLKLDPEQQQITFRFSYTSAIVTTFAMFVVVGLAFVIGRHMSRGPAPALAGPSSEQIRQGPANPEVMKLSANKPIGATRQPEVREPDDAISSTSVPPPDPARTLAPSVTSTPNAIPGKRAINLNYVIIQGYPDETGAKEAAKMLAENGITTTVERGLRGYPSNWHIVLGMDGFARISSPEYTSYVSRIELISDKFASRKSFKAFKPTAYKWDRP